jgi:NADH:ubiquinone oxidoreductase subunit B-like Fe-S oxidoreductase
MPTVFPDRRAVPMGAGPITIAIRSCAVGCPPTAEALVYGILQLQRKIRREGTIER